MQNILIEAMEDINIQINQLDKDFDFFAISELRRLRFHIFSTHEYLFFSGYITGSHKAVKSMPEITRNTEVSQC